MLNRCPAGSSGLVSRGSSWRQGSPHPAGLFRSVHDRRLGTAEHFPKLLVVAHRSDNSAGQQRWKKVRLTRLWALICVCVCVCVCVCSPVFGWTVSSTLDLVPGCFWSVWVTSHLRSINRLIVCVKAKLSPKCSLSFFCECTYLRRKRHF